MKRENLGVGCFVPTQLAERYVITALRSGRLSYGPFIKKFEREFAEAHHSRFALMVNSGTSALRIAVACLKEVGKWKDGDEILVPATTFIATANVVISNGLIPVFVDADARTYNIDPEQIEKHITKRTRAIIPVHLMGQPADMRPIMRIVRKHHLKIIEDSCETMFTDYRGKRVGSFGDISCFSTYVAHLIVTGVGGVVLTSNPTYAAVLRSLANHGRDSIYTSIDDAKGKSEKVFSQIVARRFHFVRPGFSFRLTELEGALGCAELKTVKRMIAIRQRNARTLIEKLQPLEPFIQLPWHPSYTEHAFMLFPILLRKDIGIKKRDLVNFLESRGIETRDLMPLISQPYIKKTFHPNLRQYPVSDWINKNGFYIGCHQKMGKEELEYIVHSFFAFFEQYDYSTKK